MSEAGALASAKTSVTMNPSRWEKVKNMIASNLSGVAGILPKTTQILFNNRKRKNASAPTADPQQKLRLNLYVTQSF